MKKNISIQDREYYAQQAAIMEEMQSILNRRTSTNGRQIVAELEALQRRAYPEFYRSLNRTAPKQTEPEQAQPAARPTTTTAPATTEPQEIETEPRKLNAIQIAQGLYYYFTMPIRRARKHSKARK